MLRGLYWVLGLAPNGAKTGKREAAWTLVLIVFSLQVGAMAAGTAMVQAMTAVLMLLWPSAVGAVLFVYKLQHDKQKRELEN